MGTRSTIAIQNADGSVEGIYCHWDGYLSNNGEILRDHYTDEAKIRALIALGSISSLAPSIEKPKGHCFDKPVPGYVNAYHRDRGEDLVITKKPSYLAFYKEQEQEFNYLWRDGQWFVTSYDEVERTLADAFAREAAENEAES